MTFEFCSIALVTPAGFTLRFSVPDVPPPCKPLVLAVFTPMIVPAPGNVWPEMKVTFPVWSILKLVPLMASVGSVLLGNSVNVSRTSVLPFTSSVAAGVVLLIPISDPFWKIREFTMSLDVSHMGMKSVVPLPVTLGFAGGGVFDEAEVVEEAAGLLALVFPLFASTKAEAGS